MKKHANLVWGTCLLLGLIFDVLFWQHKPGFNFAAYVVLCLIGGLALLRLDGLRMSSGARWLLPVILMFAIISVLRAEPLTVLLAVAFSLASMAILANTFLGGRWLRYSVADYATGLIRLVGSMIARPLSFHSDLRREQAARGIQRGNPHLWPVLRGALIALPILVVFAALLGSADLVFGRELSALLGLLKLEKLPEYVFRLLYILAAAYALAGVFLHAASESTDAHLSDDGRRRLSRILGFVEAAIVLTGIVILFGAFVLVQVKYFFGGQTNINVAGYTYAEYARRGFGELVAVAFFSLVLILGLGMLTRRETPPQQRLFSALSVAILALVSVMLVSAFQRLSLYELAYGFSRIRTYVHVVLIWIGLLLAATVLLELLRQEKAFAAAALTAAFGFAVTLGVLNVDGFIVRQNIDRQVGGASLDVPYLVSLSTDSVPALAQVFRSASYSRETREAAGAVLVCQEQLSRQVRAGDWRSLTISQWQAERALQGLREQLSAYRFFNDEWPASVLTPSQVVWECQGPQI